MTVRSGRRCIPPSLVDRRCQMCASRASQCGRLDAQKWHACFHPGPDQMSGVEGLRVRVLGGFDDPSCPPDVWNRLLARGNTDVVCLTWEYQRSWWETFGYGKLLLLAAERDGEVVAIAPFFVDQGEVSFVGTGAADYLDFVGCVDEPDVLEGLLTAGQERVRGFLGRVSTACRRGPRRPNGCGPPPLGSAGSAMRKHGAGTGHRPDERSRAGPEVGRERAARALLPKPRSARAAAVRRERRRCTTARRPVHAAHCPFRDGRLGGLFHRPGPSCVLRARHEERGHEGLGQIDRLDWDGRPIAYEFGWSYGDTYLGGPICFAPDLARRSPGKVLFHLLVLGARRRSRHLRPRHRSRRYKLTFATEVRATTSAPEPTI